MQVSLRVARYATETNPQIETHAALTRCSSST